MQMFTTLTCLIATAGSVLAQSIAIGAPAEWTAVTQGSDITVRVDKPLTMGNSVEVGIAIGLWPCGAIPCANIPTAPNFIDPLLYVGPYNPQYHQVGLQPYQNFTVTIPEYSYPGPPQQLSLNVAHFELVSAALQPFVEVKNVTLRLIA
ncbi:hypothetical protein L227DRAFT_562094 [Lentinus tigrinus ALCF2SS1-6]|uniref:Uncharacterized protein n=1 Tax=Lentinus tigrinus ALCF2SS1-6 TaxID=1328759 RepID=A0A5C2SHR7_9APHY|nr:hypothetical protein L227DRAFT_562094 [Lentinus tigrinus ALCF2SS1-6]